MFIGHTLYRVGRTYVAPVVSHQLGMSCHPGIYAGPLLRVLSEFHYPDRIVKCYVRDGDWFYTRKGFIRCKRLRVLDLIERVEWDSSIKYRSRATGEIRHYRDWA